MNCSQSYEQAWRVVRESGHCQQMNGAAQCHRCEHAVRERGTGTRVNGLPLPVGCDRMAVAEQGDLALVVNALLYQSAALHPCVGFARLELQADAYWSHDLPDSPFIERGSTG